MCQILFKEATIYNMWLPYELIQAWHLLLTEHTRWEHLLLIIVYIYQVALPAENQVYDAGSINSFLLILLLLYHVKATCRWAFYVEFCQGNVSSIVLGFLS